MASEAEFQAEAKKVLDLRQKLAKAETAGTIGGEKLLKYREAVETRLTMLRGSNVELIDAGLADVEKRIAALESQKSSGFMSEATFLSMSSELTQRKGELEADRSMLELYTAEQYLDYLEKQAGRFTLSSGAGPTSSVEVYNQVGGDYSPPTWAYGFALLILFFGVMGGINPLILVAGLGLVVVVRHVSAVLAGIEGASLSKAFASLMFNSALLFACYLGISLVGLLFALVVPPLVILLLPLYFVAVVAVPIYSVMYVYDTGFAKAFMTLIIQFVISIVVAGAFVFFGVLTFYSLARSITPAMPAP
jgi:hypothetical protein